MLSLQWEEDLVAKGSAPKPPKPKAPPKAIGGSRSSQTAKAKARLSPGGAAVGSMSSGWSKQARRAPWVAKQSMAINPGSPAAISKYRHSEKFVARSKHVIRPRIAKVRKKFKAPEQ
jgi:hypothetical protein